MKPSAAKNTTTNLGKIFWIIVKKRLANKEAAHVNGSKLSYIES
jgi:hypothetical protein